MRTVPACGLSIPSTRRMSVVLPAPLSPTIAWISPGAMERSMPCTPAPPGNSRTRPRASSRGVLDSVMPHLDHVEGALDRVGEGLRLVFSPREQAGHEGGEHGCRGHTGDLGGRAIRHQLLDDRSLGVARRAP